MTFISPLIPILMGVSFVIGVIMFILAIREGIDEVLLEGNYQATWAGVCVVVIPVLLLLLNYGIIALDLITMFNNQV